MTRALTGKTAHLAGLAAEDAAARHYESLGLAIAARRWRSPGGEIDLILRDGAALVFVEVKASASHATAALHLSPAQVSRLLAAASAFMGTEPAGQDTPARFDVALVDGQGRVEIVPNALIG